MGCSGSKNQAAVEPLPNASSHSSKKKYGKLASPRVPPGMGPSFPTHTDMGSPPPPDHSHDNCNAAHRSPPSSYSPYEQKMVEQHEKLMQHQQHHEPMDIADRPDFVVPIPLPDPFHPRIVTEISNPRHVPRPYPQLGNYDPTASAKRYPHCCSASVSLFCSYINPLLVALVELLSSLVLTPCRLRPWCAGARAGT